MSIEAMKQALEALDNAQHFIDEYAAAKYIHAHNAAITSLRQAIAEAEKQEQSEPVAWISKEVVTLAIDALKANQPVNYCINNNGEKFPIFSNDPIRQEQNEKAIQALEAVLKTTKDIKE